MSENTVSVVIPFYNGDLYRLALTLESLQAQTHPADEIVIVNDGSDPDYGAVLARVAETANARLVYQENAGPGAARNCGARVACGDWLAFLDADDLWAPQKIEKQVACVLGPENANKLILCRTATIDAKGHVIREHFIKAPQSTDAFVDQIIYGKVNSFTSSIFMKRTGFLELGGFDPALRFREDHHFLIRSIREYGWVLLPDCLSNRVLHDESYTAVRKVTSAGDLLSRHVRFADALQGIEPRLDRSRLIAHFAFGIGKNKAADGRIAEAIKMAVIALRYNPANLRNWFLAPAALFAAVVPSRFSKWRAGFGLKSK